MCATIRRGGDYVHHGDQRGGREALDPQQHGKEGLQLEVKRPYTRIVSGNSFWVLLTQLLYGRTALVCVVCRVSDGSAPRGLPTSLKVVYSIIYLNCTRLPVFGHACLLAISCKCLY